MFANLKTALGTAGAGFEHLVKCTIFVVGLDAEKVATYRSISSVYLGDHKPTSTMVDTGALVNPAFMVEVEAIAVVD